MMVETDILKALQKAAIAAAAASTMPTLPVKPIGRTFTVPSNGRYLELIHIPNNVTNEFWSEGKTYRGLFRLILHWGLDDTGAYSPLDVIASVASYFVKGAIFQNGSVSVKIYEEPDLTGVIEQPPETLYPVSIRYMSFQP
ncbi:hypothetical protein [Rhizobium phage RHph_X2_24]|nr:hypothetical protein [Rhizobium phage RHph_X2_24]